MSLLSLAWIVDEAEAVKKKLEAAAYWSSAAPVGRRYRFE